MARALFFRFSESSHGLGWLWKVDEEMLFSLGLVDFSAALGGEMAILGNQHQAAPGFRPNIYPLEGQKITPFRGST